MARRKISRRRFISEASCAAMGSTAFLSSALNLGMINTLSARPHIIGSSNDYKAMVCILLAGGADTYNMLIPTESTEYAEYQATRTDIALDLNASPSEIIPLNYSDNGRTFGVHAGMTGVQSLFDGGDLAFVSNIGTLIEPISNSSEYSSGLKKIPLGLYSHSDQVMQWQTSVPQSRSAVGVGGRMSDLLHDMNSIEEISMNISLSGRNRFQLGNTYSEFSISRNNTAENIGISGYPSGGSQSGYLNDVKNNAIDSLVEQTYSNIFHQTIANQTKLTAESFDIVKAAMSNVVPMNTTFSNTNLSNDLKKIAELISVRQYLGAQRQIFYVSIGGWDTHDDILERQDVLLPIVSNAMAEFNAAMVELGVHDKVVTFTISDFARTLTSNGDGSDHAWGGNQMIMGGPIGGGTIYGDYPSLNLTSNLNLSSRGRILPTTSVDEFYAELALWFGASPNDLDYILPNLCNFYSTTGCPSNPPPGYMPIGMFV